MIVASGMATSLLDLPYDIRFMIYTLVLQPQLPLCQWLRHCPQLDCTICAPDSPLRGCTNILLTNRQVHDEASELLRNTWHTIKSLQEPGSGIWRSSAPGIEQRGNVRRLKVLEAKRLRKIKFDVNFRQARERHFLTHMIIQNLSLGLEVPELWRESLKPPPEDTDLEKDIRDLAQVLQSGRSIRTLVISLYKWPDWPTFEFDRLTLNYAVGDMLALFLPLIHLDLRNGLRVDVVAEVKGDDKTCVSALEFVKLFNAKRSDFIVDCRAMRATRDTSIQE